MTYHFGPPLAAAAWPVSLRARLRHPALPGRALAAVGGGFLIATAALGLTIAAHWLRGPTLLGRGSVPAEEVVLAVVAALLGLADGRAPPAGMVPACGASPQGRPGRAGGRAQPPEAADGVRTLTSAASVEGLCAAMVARVAYRAELGLLEG